MAGRHVMVVGIALAGPACDQPQDGATPVPTPAPPPAPTPGPAPQPEPPAAHNVVLVILDDIGTDWVASYGAQPYQPPTPTLDALAAEGVRFRSAYSAPTCSPTRAGIFTGRFGRRTGIGRWIYPTEDHWSLPASEVTLPEVLAGASPPATTALVGKWHLVSYDHPTPLDHPAESGFVDFTGSLGNLGVPLDTAHGASYFAWEKVIDGVATRSDVYATIDTADEAIARLATLPEPFCLVVSLHAAHAPIHIPPASLHTRTLDASSSTVEQYAAMVESADHELGRILDAMPPATRAETTILVVGDNGTDADHILPPFDPDRSKSTLFDGGVRVPLIAAGPLVGQPGSVSDALVSVVDLLPTLAEIFGAPLPTDRALDGISFVPQLLDAATPSDRSVVFADSFYPNGPPPYDIDESMVRDDQYKLIRDYIKGKEMFFRYSDGVDEGPDLLGAPLAADDQAAFDRLSAAIDETRSSLVYEAP